MVAQRLIHYLFGELIAGELSLKDRKRFLLGSILPDAAIAADRDQAHFKTRSSDRIYYDFDAFRRLYHDRMKCDDLYFGYYMHLVEDAFYRAFVYSGCFRMPRTPEEVAILHNDYRVLNAHIVDRHGIAHLPLDAVEIDEDVGIFDVQSFLNDMSHDFAQPIKAQTVFLTESMVDEFIETYAPKVIEEAKRVQKGPSGLNARDYAWLKQK